MMIPSSNARRAAAAFAATAAVLALAPLSAANAAPGLSKLGNSSSEVSFVDVQRTVSDPLEARFVPYAQNPVISAPNVYAPSAVNVAGTWNVYFGGFGGSTPSDDVFLETTTDSTFRSGFSTRQLVVANGFYEHANDASVVFRDSLFTMALTTAVDWVDQCSILTSSDGVTWPELTDRRYEVTFDGASVANCARPSLNFNPTINRWELYFDGDVDGGARLQHLAVSAGPTPTDFTYVQSIGPWVDADIRRLDDGTYVAAYRNLVPGQIWTIYSSTSSDGRTFTAPVQILTPSDLDAYDDCGVTNPGWVIDGSSLLALLFGGTSSCGYDNHKIGVAYPQSEVTLRSGSIGHGNRQAAGPNSQTVETYGYAVDGIQVRPQPDSTPVVDQSFTVSPGDVWSVDSRSLSPTARSGAIADSSTPSNLPSNAIDGDDSTFFSSAPGAQTTTAILGVSLGSVQEVRGVTLTPRTNGYGFPIDFEIQIDDGTGWRAVPDQTYANYPSPGGAAVTLAFDESVRASDVRIVATERSSDDFGNFYLQLAEMSPLA